MEQYVIVATDKKDLYFGGDVYLFWAKDHKGYTAQLDKAGMYNVEEVALIVRNSKSDIPVRPNLLNLPHDAPLGIIRLLPRTQEVDAMLDKERKAFETAHWIATFGENK